MRVTEDMGYRENIPKVKEITEWGLPNEKLPLPRVLTRRERKALFCEHGARSICKICKL